MDHIGLQHSSNSCRFGFLEHLWKDNQRYILSRGIFNYINKLRLAFYMIENMKEYKHTLLCNIHFWKPPFLHMIFFPILDTLFSTYINEPWDTILIYKNFKWIGCGYLQSKYYICILCRTKMFNLVCQLYGCNLYVLCNNFLCECMNNMRALKVAHLKSCYFQATPNDLLRVKG